MQVDPAARFEVADATAGERVNIRFLSMETNEQFRFAQADKTEHLVAEALIKLEAERKGDAAFAKLVADPTIVADICTILESLESRRVVAANRREIHLCDGKRERLFADDADEEETPSI